MIYYFCGHRGCGKNYLANQITEKLNIKTIDTGPIIRKAYKQFNKENIGFGEWMKKNEIKYGKNFSNMLICKLVKIENGKDYIIIGYRSIEGIYYFNENFKVKEYSIFFIDGDYDLFRENYNKREKTNISDDEYRGIIEIEKKMGIDKLKEFVLDNNAIGTYYYKKENDKEIYDDVLRKIKNRKINKEEIEY